MDDTLLLQLCESDNNNARARFLQGVVEMLRADPSSGGLYDSATAFQAFIDHGGNVALYAAAVDCVAGLLADQQRGRKSLALCDLGCGTGKLLLPVLERLADTLRDTDVRIVLVDSSPDMMATLRERVLRAVPHARVEAHTASFVEFVGDHEDEEFDVVLSSFALHYCAPGADRDAVLAWVHESAELFVNVEFDVDDALLHGRQLDDAERFGVLADKFARGLREYDGLACAGLVERGFLAPVFRYNFQPTRPSGECSAAQWLTQLQRAGYANVAVVPVHDYWWAPCVAVVARSAAAFDRHAFVSPLMEVADYGAKGRGYRAAQPIAAGTLLLRERPMVIADLASEEQRYRAIGRVQHAGLATGADAAYAYVMENAFRAGTETHLFRSKTIFNHSCWCNAGSPSDAPHEVRALRDVAVGEELSISYIAGVLHSGRTCLLFLPTPLRAPHLRRLFGFACLCGRCAGREAQAVERDLVACGVRDVASDLPRNFVEHTTPASRAELVAAVQRMIAERDGNAMAAAPLLPAVAAITLHPEWQVGRRTRCCMQLTGDGKWQAGARARGV